MTNAAFKAMIAALLMVAAGCAVWFFAHRNGADAAVVPNTDTGKSGHISPGDTNGKARGWAGKRDANGKTGKDGMVESAKWEKKVPALIDSVRTADVPVTVNALGTVTPRQQAVVRARVDGLLQSISFVEGTVVKAGTVLARIDPRPFEAALSAAAGQLAKDQAQLDIARTDLLRYRKLLREDSIASQQVDAQVALVKQLEGTVAADKGNVASAQLNLSFTSITAPISGRVGLRQVDPGNIVRAADVNGLVVISEVQPITAVFAVPQESLPQIIARMRTAQDHDDTIKVDAIDRDGQLPLDSGQLLAIDNQTDPATGSVKLKALFANASQRLFPGQFVNIRITVDVLSGALTIPQSAVQRGAPGTFVYALSAEQTAVLRKIQLGPNTGDRVVVLSGLSAGEQIIADGADKVREGAAVTTVTPPPGDRSTAAVDDTTGQKGERRKRGPPPQ